MASHGSSRVSSIAARTRVLIVDDNPEVAYVLSEILISLGYAVQTAVDGREAIALFQADSPAVVLLDVRMPEMNGTEVFAELQRIDARVPVIFVTATTDEATARQLLHAGAFDFVSKPVDRKYLGLAVAAATGDPWPVIARDLDDAPSDGKSGALKMAYGVMALCRRANGPEHERMRLEQLVHLALRHALTGQGEQALECLHQVHAWLGEDALAWMAPGDAEALRIELAPLAAAVPAPDPGDGDLRGVCVLLVDDEADSREVMAVALELAGATVTTVSSAREALKVLEARAPDVLVSDIMMPDRDGYWLNREAKALMRRRSTELPTLAVTGFARDHDRDLALASGFDDYLPKPVDPGELCRRVATLVSD